MAMSLQRKKFPLRSIKENERAWMKKECGQVNWVVGLFLVLFVAVFLMAALQAERFRTVALYMEDALAASNLASALVDLEEYGISHRILVAEPEEAYERYRNALIENLNLNGELQGGVNSVVPGAVRVENYTVYNVDGEKVWVYQFDTRGESLREERLGVVTAPNGIPIENTSVYSEISFEVKVFWGGQITAHKGKLVDIAENS